MFKREEGFTLPELLATIAILGLILAIATPTWNNVTASRELEYATNQLTSDLRLAHTRATNRLVSYEVQLDVDNRTYLMDGEERFLPDGAQISSADAETMTFRAPGSVDPDDEDTLVIEVSAGSEGLSREVSVNTATSRVEATPVEATP